jgi:hypothetical protein
VVLLVSNLDVRTFSPTIEAALEREVSTDAVPQLATTRRWSFLLPILMVALSASLMVLAEKQQPTLRGMGTGWEVPARVINALVNGPSFYLSARLPTRIPNSLNRSLNYEANRLLGIAAFWFLVGLSIERRKNKQALGQHHPILAGVLFTLAALVCGWAGIGVGRNPNLIWAVVSKYPLRTWATMILSQELWLLGLSAYFARGALIAFRRRLTGTA